MSDPQQPAAGFRPSPSSPQSPRVILSPKPTLMPKPAPIAPARPATATASAPRADDPISLVEDATEEQASPTRKITFGPQIGHKKHEWQRQPTATGTGAVRVRSFHGKLSEQGLEYLDDSINEWLDAHPEVEVKFVTSNIGMFDGKMKDMAVILNVWY